MYGTVKNIMFIKNVWTNIFWLKFFHRLATLTLFQTIIHTENTQMLLFFLCLDLNHDDKLTIHAILSKFSVGTSHFSAKVLNFEKDLTIHFLSI